MATAGLAVSLLTQSVWEVVISGTQRQCDIETRKEQEVIDKPTVKKKKKGQISKSVNLLYLFSSSLSVFSIRFLRVSMCHPHPHPVYGVRWVIVPNLSAFWWCAVSATRTNTHTQTSCMSFSELCHWILGTVGACQVAVIRPTELHCCLWWHHQTQSLI